MDCLLQIARAGTRFLGQHSSPGWASWIDEATGERGDVVDSAASRAWAVDIERPIRN